jgi:hypothetical protein
MDYKQSNKNLIKTIRETRQKIITLNKESLELNNKLQTNQNKLNQTKVLMDSLIECLSQNLNDEEADGAEHP